MSRYLVEFKELINPITAKTISPDDPKSQEKLGNFMRDFAELEIKYTLVGDEDGPISFMINKKDRFRAKNKKPLIIRKLREARCKIKRFWYKKIRGM